MALTSLQQQMADDGAQIFANGDDFSEPIIYTQYATTNATATATLTDGGIASVTVTAGGSGYATPPFITIVGDGTGATAEAILDGGVVTGVVVTNAGEGYTTATLTIGGPREISAQVIRPALRPVAESPDGVYEPIELYITNAYPAGVEAIDRRADKITLAEVLGRTPKAFGIEILGQDQGMWHLRLR